MKTPLLLINLKAYKEGLGMQGLKIAKSAEKVAGKSRVNIALAVQPTDIMLVSRNTKLPVFAQHVDAVEYGSRTGHILPEAVKKAGAAGTLINHAERKVSLGVIKETIARAHEAGLIVVACAADLEEAKNIAKLKEKPEFIAYEPPELIGGDVSVSTSKPEILGKTVREINKISEKITVLCGAGVKNYTDAKTARELGAKGLLVASGIVKAENKKKAILELCSGLKK